METTNKSIGYYTIETQDLDGHLFGGDRLNFWAWTEIDRKDDEDEAKKAYEEGLKKYNTLRLVHTTFDVVKQTRTSPAFLADLENHIDATEKSLREQVIWFLKSLDTPEYPCEIRLAGGLTITLLELDPIDQELVGVNISSKGEPDDRLELSDFPMREQLTILKSIVSE